MSQEIKLYELLYLIPGSLSEQEMDPILEHVRSLIAAQQGIITRENPAVRRKLAYPIKQYSHGFYVLIYFEALPSVIKELNTTLTHTTSVLRHVLIQTSHMTELAPQRADITQPKDSKQTEPPKEVSPSGHFSPAEEPPAVSDSPEPLAHTEEPVLEETSKNEPQEDDKKESGPKKKTPKREKKSKISLDDLDEKLDEILTSDTL